jgi:hypothetical protein
MREDSGVIDLFAIHNRASGVTPERAVPPDLFSSPPPAFTTDLGIVPTSSSDVGDDDDANPFRTDRREVSASHSARARTCTRSARSRASAQSDAFVASVASAAFVSSATSVPFAPRLLRTSQTVAAITTITAPSAIQASAGAFFITSNSFWPK